ncbi:MAG: hypothetical protein MUC58_13210 [Rhizobiaceae bacterium]|nr:hypothetical protein [Rhizobiaceae bacterium]
MSAAAAPEGARKTAALLLAMGRPLAQRMVQRFEPDELRLLARSARAMPPLNRAVVDALVEDFARHFVDQVGSAPVADEMDAIIGGSPPDSSGLDAGLIDRAPPADPWVSVLAAPPERLAEVLSGETAPIVCAALSRFVPAQAAKVIALLPEALRPPVITGMVGMSPVADAIMRAIGTQLESMLAVEDKSAAASANRKRVAAVLNGLARPEADALLLAVETSDPAEATAIRALLFDFADIIRLQPADRSVLFDSVSAELVMTALPGAEDALRDAVLAALGARARRMVEAELQNGTPPKPEKTYAARRAIADAALDLAEAGRISLSAPEQTGV